MWQLVRGYEGVKRSLSETIAVHCGVGKWAGVAAEVEGTGQRGGRSKGGEQMGRVLPNGR